MTDEEKSIVRQAATDALQDLAEPPLAAATPEAASRFSWTRLDTFLSPILKVFILVTVVLGGLEYLDKQREERVSRSLEYVKTWDQSGFRSAYSRVNSALYPMYLAARQAIDSAPSDADRARYFANIGDRLTGGDDQFDTPFEQDVEYLFYFFDDAALCSSEGLCDGSVIRAFIGEDMRTFWTYFSKYAERKDDAGYGNYGYWTERFVSGAI
jgi:hypothetical protein